MTNQPKTTWEKELSEVRGSNESTLYAYSNSANPQGMMAKDEIQRRQNLELQSIAHKNAKELLSIAQKKSRISTLAAVASAIAAFFSAAAAFLSFYH